MGYCPTCYPFSGSRAKSYPIPGSWVTWRPSARQLEQVHNTTYCDDDDGDVDGDGDDGGDGGDDDDGDGDDDDGDYSHISEIQKFYWFLCLVSAPPIFHFQVTILFLLKGRAKFLGDRTSTWRKALHQSLCQQQQGQVKNPTG